MILLEAHMILYIVLERCNGYFILRLRMTALTQVCVTAVVHTKLKPVCASKEYSGKLKASEQLYLLMMEINANASHLSCVCLICNWEMKVKRSQVKTHTHTHLSAWDVVFPACWSPTEKTSDVCSVCSHNPPCFQHHNADLSWVCVTACLQCVLAKSRGKKLKHKRSMWNLCMY